MPNIEIFRNDPNVRDHADGDMIFRQGDRGDVMYVIVDGEVALEVDDHPLDVVGPGGIIGEMALVDGQPRSASARANGAVQLAPIDKRRFAYLVQNTPYFAIEVMQIMANRLRRMDSLLPD